MIVLDGATGTELARRGIDTRGRLFSAAALLDERGQQALREVHREYVRAGAQVITANTFRTNRYAAGERWRELTRLAVRIAREESGGALVAGSIAPIADCYRPELMPDPVRVMREHREHARVLAEAGCDLLLVETVADGYEGSVAMMEAADTGLPVWVSAMASRTGIMLNGLDDLRAFFQMARSLFGVSALLINCTPCDGIDEALGFVSDLGVPFGAYAHMGEVDPASGWPSTPRLSPDEYAARAQRWLERGATIVGGCCGTDPSHIAALARISPIRHDPCQPDRRIVQ